MARRVSEGRRGRQGLGASLTPQGRAIIRALRDARRQAPAFVVSCGVLPELSESASERLYAIARDIAERHLNGRRRRVELQRTLGRAVKSSVDSDRVEQQLTALVAAETTAGYLLGLSVGLAIHALPERLTRSGR